LRPTRPAGLRLNPGKRVVLDQIFAVHPGGNVAELGRKIIRGTCRIRIEREGGLAIRTRGAPKPKIDPPWSQRLQYPELLGHFQAGVMRQHDTGGPEPYTPR
jgi:hypothetical protein